MTPNAFFLRLFYFILFEIKKDAVNYCVLVNKLSEFMGEELIQLGIPDAQCSSVTLHWEGFQENRTF